MNKDSKILVTGARGFLGRFVVRKFNEHGYNNLVELGGSKVCDLRNPHEVHSILTIHRPDVVVHLAARVGGIGENQKYSGAFFYDNMSMGMNLIESARKLDVKKFVLLSTVCAYPHTTPVPFKEADLWNGYPEPTNAPYGIAKKALSEMLIAYKKQYDFNGITLIPVNLYGPNCPGDTHVIPDLIRKFFAAQKQGLDQVVVWGTGSASREFLYVDDCAEAIVKATLNYDDPKPVNIGTGQEITIKGLVEILKCMIPGKYSIYWDVSKPDGQPRRCLDTTRAKEEFGFEASTSLQAGLTKTVNWYKEYANAS